SASSRLRIAGVLLTKLSSTTGAYPPRASSTTMCEPTKPAPPVTRTLSGMTMDATRSARTPASMRELAAQKKPGIARLLSCRAVACALGGPSLFAGRVATVDELDQRH